MTGPFSAYSLGRTNWIVRDSEGERVCTLYDQRWDQAKLVAEALAAMLNAVPGQSAKETLEAMRDTGMVAHADCDELRQAKAVIAALQFGDGGRIPHASTPERPGDYERLLAVVRQYADRGANWRRYPIPCTGAVEDDVCLLGPEAAERCLRELGSVDPERM